VTRLRIAVVDGVHKQAFYAPLYAAIDAEWVDIASRALLDAAPEHFDLLLLNDEFGALATSELLRWRARGVPSLHLADGVLEWRNAHANPRSADEHHGLPLMRPVQADRIACLGPAQARLLESMGNFGRCEITGSPRLDVHGVAREPCALPAQGARVLLASARTPGFDDAQRAAAGRAFADLRDWFAQAELPRTRGWRANWRLAPELAQELGIVDNPIERDAASALRDCDALIAQPSTLALEGMLHGKLVVLVDYTHVPAWVHAAWRIDAREQLDSEMHALATCDPARLSWQRVLQVDQACGDAQASARVAVLTQRLIEFGRQARAAGQPLSVPQGPLLSPTAEWMDLAAWRTHRLALEFPQHPVFAMQDLARVQAELGAARLCIEHLRVERAQIEASTSWRIARLLARVGSMLGVGRRSRDG
jgi:hypothetical protein